MKPLQFLKRLFALPLVVAVAGAARSRWLPSTPIVPSA